VLVIIETSIEKRGFDKEDDRDEEIIWKWKEYRDI